MKTFALNAEPRTDLGKKASKALRKENKIPVVLNGGKIVELEDGKYTGTLQPGEKVVPIGRDGKAIITELYAPVSDDVKSELADKYGAAMTNLGKLEEILPGVIEEIKAEREALMASIEVQ